MPNVTPNYDLFLPLVNSATDQDLWGGYLNENFSSLDTIIKSVSDAADAAAQAGVNSDITDLTGIDDTIQTIVGAGQLRLANNTVINCTNIAGSAQIPVQAGNATSPIHLTALGQFLLTLGSPQISFIIPAWDGSAKRNFIIKAGVVSSPSGNSINAVSFSSAFPTAIFGAWATVQGDTSTASNANIGAIKTNSISSSGMNLVYCDDVTATSIYWLAIGY